MNKFGNIPYDTYTLADGRSVCVPDRRFDALPTGARGVRTRGCPYTLTVMMGDSPEGWILADKVRRPWDC